MVVAVNNATCGYPGRQVVLRRISFSIGKGSLLFILGPIGSGKTTLLKCIAGLLHPSEGEIRVNGIPVSNLHLKERFKIIGYMTQNFLPPNMKLADFILLGRYPWKTGLLPTKKDIEITWRIAELLNLRNRLDDPVSELSGGLQRKALLAKVLTQEPDILLLDEPTSNLDPKEAIEIMEFIKKVVKSGEKTAIIATHDIVLAAHYADKVLLLRNGEIIAFGGLEVFTSENLTKTYSIPIEVEETNGSITIRISPTPPLKNAIQYNIILDSKDSQ